MKFTTKEKDEIAVRRYLSKEGIHVELQVETDNRGALVFLAPEEAVRLGNALIKAAQEKEARK